MITAHSAPIDLAFEFILGDSLAEVASELRLIDVDSLIGHISNDRVENIHNLVNASSELFFRPGTLVFGDLAEVAMDWRCPPRIELAMEFHCESVSIFFRLLLNAVHVGVEIDHVWFGCDCATTPERIAAVSRAVSEARIDRAHFGMCGVERSAAVGRRPRE